MSILCQGRGVEVEMSLDGMEVDNKLVMQVFSIQIELIILLRTLCLFLNLFPFIVSERDNA